MNKNNYKYDVIIVGAGPAGCSCALSLAGSGLKIAVLEKEKFPRDKICGDGLSVDVANQLAWISEKLSNDFYKFENKLPSSGMRIFSPDKSVVDILIKNSKTNKNAYTCKRADFDNFLFNQLKCYKNIETFENCNVNKLSFLSAKAIVESDDSLFEGDLLVGADGTNSVISKNLNNNYKRKKINTIVALTQYYENVTDLHPDNLIEFHFIKNLLPGYFWIFPLPNGHANIGLGISLKKKVSKRINLKNEFYSIINEHPTIARRFNNAKQVGKIKGGSLIVSGLKKKKISGERFLLLGDSASLVNPFSGEGVANAIRSGRIAAVHIIKGFEMKRFDAEFNRNYDCEIDKKIRKELRKYYFLKMILANQVLLNFGLKIINRNPKIKSQMVMGFIENYNVFINIINPLFYLKKLFK